MPTSAVFRLSLVAGLLACCGTAFAAPKYAVTDLGTLGGTSSWATSINASGQIVGSSYTTGDAAAHAFLYSAGTMTDLGTLGGTLSWAVGMNDKGQVIGFSGVTNDLRWEPFLYSDGTMYNLHDLIDPQSGYRFDDYRFAINDSGELAIAGWTPTGQYRAFLLTPVSDIPEPTTLTLLGLGCAALLRSRRRH